MKAERNKGRKNKMRKTADESRFSLLPRVGDIIQEIEKWGEIGIVL
jgi:hypothetical protein